MMKLRGAILFAKDVPTLAAFYRDAFGFAVISESPTWVELGAGAATLGLHAIPKDVADAISITTPPTRRATTPIKLTFEVSMLTIAIAELTRHGAVMDAPSAFGTCDGVDPEGNVFQIVRA
jgi:catechol 2,3-dioxygenase-like lactoylglutathione lyase family enzyme